MAQNHSDIANLASQRGDGHLDYLVGRSRYAAEKHLK
jgi:hypothetical protein